MIKCERGNLHMRGNGVILSADAICILKGMRNVLADQYGAENVEDEMLHLVKVSAMSDEQIHDATKKMSEQLIEKALKDIFG